MIRRTARGSLMSRCEGLLIQYILHESVLLLLLAWQSLLIWASIVAPLSKVFIPCSSLSLILTSPLLCGGYRPDETSNCEWLAAPANFPDGLFTNKAAGRRQTKTAHGGLQRSCGSVREIWQKRKLSLPLFLKRSLPPSISLQANWAEPCQHWEGALMTAACECMCVCVSARDRGRKSVMERREM